MKKRNITTEAEAIAYAQEWQNWASEEDLSYRELAEWSDIFTELGKRFNLTEEFITNGIL